MELHVTLNYPLYFDFPINSLVHSAQG